MIEKIIKELVSRNVKIQYISKIFIGYEMDVKIFESYSVIYIDILNFKLWKKLMKTFTEFNNYKIKYHYCGEYSNVPLSNSFLCKRTKKEIKYINKRKNYCEKCNLNKCDINECIILK